MSQETIEKTFEVERPAKLKADNICGSVDIQPGADGEIRVSAVKRLDSGDAENTRIEIEQQPDGQVTVKTRYNKNIFDWLLNSKPCDVDYTILVPAACLVEVNAVSSTSAVKGLQGDAAIKSVSGNVRVTDLTGNIRLDAVSADVFGENLNGCMNVKSVSGTVDIDKSVCKSITANTVSGDLNFETSLGDEGPYRFNSVSGSIRMTIPDGTGCRARMNSLSGGIQTDMPATFSRHGRNRAVEIHGGGVTLEANTVSGLFLLKCAGDDKPASAPQTAEERKAILDRVANGGLTVADALSQLQG